MTLPIQARNIHVVYRTKLYQDGANRLRPLPLPAELSKRVARWLKDREVLVAIYRLGDLEIDLPRMVVERVKRDLLNAAEEDIKSFIAFLAYDAANSYIKMLIPSLSLTLETPKTVEVKDDYIDFKGQKIKVRKITATGFSIYPLEKTSNSIKVVCELYDLPGQLDRYDFSRCRIVVNLKQLLEETGIRWDLAR